MKTVYLHVGNFKTGTSAIQKYCSERRSALLSDGVNYLQSARPSGDRTSHGRIPLSLYCRLGAFAPDWYDDTIPYEQVAEAVAAEIADTDAPAILISSEEFYRLPSCADDVKYNAMEQLRQLFDGCAVKVIMYVREPMDFLKSWYNQLNKPLLPTVRFTDCFYSLDKSLLLPHVNASFWRNCFGDDCLIVQPYNPDEGRHVQYFLQLVGLSGVELRPSASKRVNPGRKEGTLERDRIAKIMALPTREQRQQYLGSRAFASMDNFENFEIVIHRVNKYFDTFCRREGLEDMISEVSLGALLVHEERVNPRDIYPGRGIRSSFYAFLNKPITREAKRMLKKFLP